MRVTLSKRQREGGRDRRRERGRETLEGAGDRSTASVAIARGCEGKCYSRDEKLLSTAKTSSCRQVSETRI